VSAVTTDYFIRGSRGVYKCVGATEGDSVQVIEWKVKKLSHLTGG